MQFDWCRLGPLSANILNLFRIRGPVHPGSPFQIDRTFAGVPFRSTRLAFFFDESGPIGVPVSRRYLSRRCHLLAVGMVDEPKRERKRSPKTTATQSAASFRPDRCLAKELLEFPKTGISYGIFLGKLLRPSSDILLVSLNCCSSLVASFHRFILISLIHLLVVFPLFFLIWLDFIRWEPNIENNIEGLLLSKGELQPKNRTPCIVQLDSFLLNFYNNFSLFLILALFNQDRVKWKGNHWNINFDDRVNIKNKSHSKWNSPYLGPSCWLMKT